ncbi:hypothetical protein ZIOFF_033571 [Zingiber officinale]|uniref:Uncharacterized protein n=1 Tax=Zingiber officinale TaxID=94328 RepID=A0A8J5GJT6_ZINOF|nr:hypothetical protein ZIOFF_033571 [Zingiber officinale]
MELTINDLALKLITSKELFESAHATHLRAADQMIIAALALDIETLVWHNLLKHAEEELQQVHEQMLLTNDVKSELCSASALLVNLKAELASLDHATSELEEARSHIEKSRESVCSLHIQLSTLQCELEREKADLSTLREREGFVSASLSSLEAQLNSVNFELELIQERKEVTKKMAGDEQAKLQEASEEAERVKQVANTAYEELRKAKEDATRAKAEATPMELRLAESPVAGKLVRVKGKIGLSQDGELQLTRCSVMVEEGPDVEYLHIVSKERTGDYLKFVVDDGTRCIPCILDVIDRSHLGIAAEVETEIALREAATVELEKLVRVRGMITLGEEDGLQLKVRDVVVERDPNMEALHWMDCIRFARTCYDRAARP